MRHPAMRFTAGLWILPRRPPLICGMADCFTPFTGPDRLPELLLACKQHRLTPKRMTLVFPTTAHSPSLVLLEAKKHGAPGLFLTKPLIIYRAGLEQKNENYTDDMKYIYENGAFHEQYQKP